MKRIYTSPRSRAVELQQESLLAASNDDNTLDGYGTDGYDVTNNKMGSGVQLAREQSMWDEMW